MTEQQLNSVISRSLRWSFKIPDARGTTGILPFDGFGVTGEGQPVYWEAKNLNKLQAFSFEKVRPHQIENMLQIKQLSLPALTLLLIGVSFSSRDRRLYVFADPSAWAVRRAYKQSITKIEFETLTNWIPIKNGRIDESDLIDTAMEAEFAGI